MVFVKNNVGLATDMKLKVIFAFLFIIALSATATGQRDSIRTVDSIRPKPKPSVNRIFTPQRAVLFRFNYTAAIPGGDLVKRFGGFSNLGMSVGLKLESGWDLRIEGGFLFSRNVKEYTVLDSIRNSDGYLTDQNGYNFDPVISMRGYTVGAHIGKLFPVDRNQNSGILVSLGGGFIQHKLHFQKLNNGAPQVTPAYLKGYDRLTNGFVINEFIGYQYLSMKGLINFYAGIEFAQGSTQYARNWNYDLMGPDNRRRRDNYWGIRIGWILPIYGTNKGQDEFYFR